MLSTTATHTCCVIAPLHLPAGRLPLVEGALRREISQAVVDGYTHFISGFSKGADLLFAGIVAELMETNPALTLEAALPYRNRIHTPDARFRRLLAKCSIIGVSCETYTPSCYHQGNCKMVSESQRVVAVYDGRTGGGTAFTMSYASLLGRELRVVPIR